MKYNTGIQSSEMNKRKLLGKSIIFMDWMAAGWTGKCIFLQFTEVFVMFGLSFQFL